jgi:hypothetical protein
MALSLPLQRKSIQSVARKAQLDGRLGAVPFKSGLANKVRRVVFDEEKKDF